MTRRVFQCDGAAIPAEWASQYHEAPPVQIGRFGPAAQVSLRLQEGSDPLTGTLRGHAYDLVCIASYVYVADQLVSRGGKTDIYGESWQRELAVCMPIGDPKFWNSANVRTLLEQTVNFVSGAVWHFAFSTSRSPEQLPLAIDQRSTQYNPDSVVLFSGGADSLCATVEAVLDENLKPVLVSHWSVPLMNSSQRELVDQLRQRIPNWQFPHSKFEVNKVKTQERDTTQRSRSFLFACLGAAVASSIQSNKVILADNGVVSLNLPINDQLLGSLASRSTHPRFIEAFNELSKAVLPYKPQVFNTLRERTKAEGLNILLRHGLPELLLATNSCAHRRNLSKEKPQCGVCSQCVDRRFATLAAGMEKFDPHDRYMKDIFRDGLEGDAVTMAESYIRFYRKVRLLSPEALYTEYPQMAEAIALQDPTPDSTANKYAAMIQRHANSVINVLADQVTAASGDFASGLLPATCLINLSAPPLTASIPPSLDFLHSDNYRSIRWQGQTLTLTQLQAEVVRMLHQAHRTGTPDLAWNQIKPRLTALERYPARMHDIFKESPAWMTLVVKRARSIYRLDL